MNLCFRLVEIRKIFIHLEYIIRRQPLGTKTLKEYNTIQDAANSTFTAWNICPTQ